VSKLCERPGCSEPGAAAYGMVPEDLLFWIAPLADAPTDDPNVLCRRHADAMVVPRGWTLDDRREPTPRLFKPRPAPAQAPPAPAPRRRRPHQGDAGEQLVIDGTGEIPRPAITGDLDDTDGAVHDTDATATSSAPASPWQPEFDTDDDLGGLLQVSTPLLARAFRGTDRKRA
jgi:Protein of unknown function (DUF3499)